MSKDPFPTDINIAEAFDRDQTIRLEVDGGSNRQIIICSAEDFANTQTDLYDSLSGLYGISETTLDEILDFANQKPKQSKKSYVAVLVDRSEGEMEVKSGIVFTRTTEAGVSAEEPCYEIFDIQTCLTESLCTLTAGLLSAFEKDKAGINTLLATIPRDSDLKDMDIKAFMTYLDGWELENNPERGYMQRPVIFGYSYEEGIIYIANINACEFYLGDVQVSGNSITQIYYTGMTEAQITRLVNALKIATILDENWIPEEGELTLYTFEQPSQLLQSEFDSIVENAIRTTRNSL